MTALSSEAQHFQWTEDQLEEYLLKVMIFFFYFSSFIDQF